MLSLLDHFLFMTESARLDLNKRLGWHGGAVVCTVASQQEGSKFEVAANWGLSL